MKDRDLGYRSTEANLPSEALTGRQDDTRTPDIHLLQARTAEQLFKRAALERIATGLSLISQAVGFSIIGILILATRHQAELNDSAGGGPAAIVGGTSALFVGTVFLIGTLLYWRFCAKRSAGLALSRKTARLTFARPELTPAIAALA